MGWCLTTYNTTKRAPDRTEHHARSETEMVALEKLESETADIQYIDKPTNVA